MQKRSLYAAFVAAVLAVAGAIFAVSRRRPAPPIPESPVKTQMPESAIPPIAVPEAPPPAVVEQAPDQTITRPSILTLLASGLGVGCLTAAQALLLHSRNPIAPLILFVIGVMALQPLLASQAQRPRPEILLFGGRSFVAPIILALCVVTLLLNILARPPLNPLPGQFQMFSAFMAVLVVPAVYAMGDAYGGSQVGLIAAGFAAVSGWTLSLGKAEPEYISLAIISAVSLVALEYIRRRQGHFIYAIWVIFFLGAVVALTWLMTPSSSPDPFREEQIPANPQLSISEGFFTSLLMFNLTSDPNPAHGIIDRPVFSPILSAFFIVGLLSLAWRINANRRRVDVFLLAALGIALLPSAFQTGLPVRYPDLQRGAMALPIAMVIAAIGVFSLAEALIASLDRAGFAIAAILVIVALSIIAIDASQHYYNFFLPIYQQGWSVLSHQ